MDGLRRQRAPEHGQAIIEAQPGALGTDSARFMTSHWMYMLQALCQGQALSVALAQKVCQGFICDCSRTMLLDPAVEVLTCPDCPASITLASSCDRVSAKLPFSMKTGHQYFGKGSIIQASISMFATHAPGRVCLGYRGKYREGPEPRAKAGACAANTAVQAAETRAMHSYINILQVHSGRTDALAVGT